MSDALLARASDLLAKFEANLKWAKEHSVEVGQHAGRFVVVNDGKIIFDSPTREKAEARGRKVPGAYVTYVTPEQWAWIL